VVDPATVEDYLRKEERPFERIDASTWRSAFHGETKSFRFFIRLTENWIFFTIVPFVLAPKTERGQHSLHRLLLRLNREINMAKFAIDDDEDVVLTVELPTENLDQSEFKDALDALSYYADKHYLEAARIGGDEQA
jgi:hypothetical protein